MIHVSLSHYAPNKSVTPSIAVRDMTGLTLLAGAHNEISHLTMRRKNHQNMKSVGTARLDAASYPLLQRKTS